VEFQIHIKTTNSTQSNSTEMSNPIEIVPLSNSSPELFNQFNEISSTFVEKVEKGTIWYNGKKYVGEYKIGGIKHGYGVIYKNGKIAYEGEFQDNRYNGLGRFYHPHGWIMYKGMFKNGEFNGHGIEFDGENVLYEGEFQDGLYHGHGIEFVNGNIVYEGEWINGRKVNQ
jgi:hypothetical protein